ncbi:glycosyl hydrolase family 8 [Trichococcus shcherbakoviae]|uniref:Xylanase n=1 Tax=Trichococcus shcherbakoviae subsp. psychrophilus TaxID=2585775 RepID=A0A5C5E5I4_9LACT|nr:glycosyl hydrolase family 8 [Trichococcus shcherbakoviae]TNV68055.1 xylanase [Trichococcus shcherbakoviae subsp. psychrophilus]
MKHYRNLFVECGYSEEEVSAKIREVWEKLFLEEESKARIYYTDDMGGYLLDTGNDDARSEGMSYGMMMAVQMGDKEIFDKIWAWSYKNMYHQEGFNKGYFAWHCTTDGKKLDDGPAPDGEEFFAMALFFAGNRWGNGEGIYNYAEMARTILSDCLHKGHEREGHAMWNRDNYLIRFVPGLEFSDPSYHLPHFYELFSKWANEEDREFWEQAAKASRAYIRLSAHPETGLTPEYAYDDGTANDERGFGHFYSDSYRTAANIGMDYEWFGCEETPVEVVENIHKFFQGVNPEEYTRYYLDGRAFEEKARHPLGLLATNASASLAYADGTKGKWFIDLLWESPLRTDRNRYYDNCLYFFAVLALSGNYRIWE